MALVGNFWRGAMRDSLRRLAASDDQVKMMSRRLGRKNMRVRVELMDGSIVDIDVDRKARGAELLDKVCDALDLIEKDYFGLLYESRGDPRVWIDLDKRLSKSFKNDPWDVRFAVKFYPPEPAELQEELTRYQLEMAVRRDLLEGRLPCSAVTYALLASYLLQAELGDYEDSGLNAGSFTEYRLTPPDALTPALEEKIVELYKNHKGQTPAEAELNYLDNAKKLHMYGVDLHKAKDSEDIDISLGVCSTGVSIYRDGLLMNRFPWAKVLKISYNKRIFTLRLRASECDEFETQVSFKLPSTYSCKKLWKACVEQHIFFRRTAPVVVERISGFPRLGSRRTSCRSTLHQIRCTPVHRDQPAFPRTLLTR